MGTFSRGKTKTLLILPEGGGVDLHEPEVSGHTVTDGDLDDVSRDDVDGLDLLHAILVGPDHLAGLGLVLLQSLDSLLSVPLLQADFVKLLKSYCQNVSVKY